VAKATQTHQNESTFWYLAGTYPASFQNNPDLVILCEVAERRQACPKLYFRGMCEGVTQQPQVAGESRHSNPMKL
jgi:hypothetical protein